MKKMVLLSLLIAVVTFNSAAQVKPGKKKNPYQTGTQKRTKSSNAPTSVLLINSSNYSAYSPTTGNRLRITDPTITTFNERASGADVPITSSGVWGMPKGTYGYAKGKLFLRSTTATSSGTAYGSGAVGTGTSINSIGTSETTIGVNGKSNDAGPWLWGNRQPVYNGPTKAPIKTENKQ